jgi:hypothetical protein
MRDFSTTSFATRLTHKALGHGGRQTPYHMIMTGRIVIQQVIAIGRFDLPFKHDAITI